jgi:UDP-glucose 4-epimerase
MAVALVTGGCGFIGTWVLRELIEHSILPVVVDNQSMPVRWHRILKDDALRVIHAEARLTDPESLLQLIGRYKITHVIHLAAMLTPACQQDPWQGFQVNVAGSTAVFEAVRRSRQIQGLSYASSYAVYGPETGEDAALSNRPPTFYGAYKQAVDLIAEQYARHFGVSSVAVRPHVVYGPERTLGLTAGPSLACRAAARKESYTIGYTGTVGYDYVEDVARAFVRAAIQAPAGSQVVDLPGEQLTTDQFLRVIEAVEPSCRGRIKVDGPAIPANVPPHPRLITELFPDWQPTTVIDGVVKTIEFYRSSFQRAADDTR